MLWHAGFFEYDDAIFIDTDHASFNDRCFKKGFYRIVFFGNALAFIDQEWKRETECFLKMFMGFRFGVIDPKDANTRFFKTFPVIFDRAELKRASGGHVARIKNEKDGRFFENVFDGIIVSIRVLQGKHGRFVAHG